MAIPRKINYAVDLEVMVRASAEVWVEVPEDVKEEDREEWAEEEARHQVRIGQVTWNMEDPDERDVEVDQIVECDW